MQEHHEQQHSLRHSAAAKEAGCASQRILCCQGGLLSSCGSRVGGCQVSSPHDCAFPLQGPAPFLVCDIEFLPCIHFQVTGSCRQHSTECGRFATAVKGCCYAGKSSLLHLLSARDMGTRDKERSAAQHGTALERNFLPAGEPGRHMRQQRNRAARERPAQTRQCPLQQ